MKVSKVVGIGAATAAVLIVVAIIYLWSSLDSLVEAAIEKYGSQATQTQVSVAAVKLSLGSGEGSTEGLEVNSPAGCSRKQLFTLGMITVAIEPETITDEVIVINKIIIKAPQVFYEINDKGESNVDALKKNLQQSSKSSEKSETTDGKEVKLIIRKLVIESGEIDARIAAMGEKNLSANLPRIELTDIGKKSGGATPAEVAEKVADVLIKKVGPAVASLGVEQYLGKTADEAKAELESGVTEALDEKLGGSLKGLFGK